MNKYYYLIASLPPLDGRISPKNSDYEDAIFFIDGLLSEHDRRLFKYLLYPSDIKNIINHIAGERDLPIIHPFVLSPGTKSERDIRSFLKGKSDFEGFLNAFYEDCRDQLNDLSLVDIEKILNERFYQSVFEQGDTFLTSYFTFDRDLKNITVISNARKFDFDPNKYLQGEFLSNQKFIISGEYSFMEEINNGPKDDSPQSLEKVLDRIRQRYIDQLSSFSFFDLHAVFAWFLKYQILHRWSGEWAKEEVDKKITALSEHAMKEFTMPDLFTNQKAKTS